MSRMLAALRQIEERNSRDPLWPTSLLATAARPAVNSPKASEVKDINLSELLSVQIASALPVSAADASGELRGVLPVVKRSTQTLQAVAVGSVDRGGDDRVLFASELYQPTHARNRIMPSETKGTFGSPDSWDAGWPNAGALPDTLANLTPATVAAAHDAAVRTDIRDHSAGSKSPSSEHGLAGKEGPKDASKAGSKSIPLPVSDFDRQSIYRKLCGRLLATHPKHEAMASTVAMFVAPVPIGDDEFSIVELARSAAESLSGRILLVALDPKTEFLPYELLNAGGSGISDVWNEKAAWSQAKQATSHSRIDLVTWGTLPADPAPGPLSWSELRFDYQLVLLAAGSEITPAAERLAPSCDSVVLVVGLGSAGQEDTTTAARRLARAGAPLAGCVVTGVTR